MLRGSSLFPCYTSLSSQLASTRQNFCGILTGGSQRSFRRTSITSTSSSASRWIGCADAALQSLTCPAQPEGACPSLCSALLEGQRSEAPPGVPSRPQSSTTEAEKEKIKEVCSPGERADTAHTHTHPGWWTGTPEPSCPIPRVFL